MVSMEIALCAIIVSCFGAIVGFGGGVFMVPLLVILFKIPIKLAIGSVIFALIPASAISTLFNIKSATIDYYAALILELPTILGTFLGAYLTDVLPLDAVEILFSAIIITIGIFTIYKSGTTSNKRDKTTWLYQLNKIGWSIIRKTPHGVYKINFLVAAIFGLFSGIIAGFLGIGGGFLKVPIMLHVIKMPSFVAASTSLFMIFFTSISGSLSHYYLGHIYFDQAIPVLIGFPLGAILGNLINTKVSSASLQQMIGSGLILAGISIMVNRFWVSSI